MPNELIELPSYTLDDFMNGTAPFEFLYGLEDRFVQERMVQRMKILAQSVGLRSFMKMWDAYKKSMSKQADTDDGRVSSFEGLPLNEIKTGQYICDSDGVHILDNYGFKQTVCPHPIAPIRRYVNVDNGEEYLEIWFRKYRGENDPVTKTIVVSKDDISNGISKLAKYGVVVTPQNAKYLSAYLLNIEQYNYGDIPEQVSVTRLGWVGDNKFSPYVNDIRFDGEENFGGMFKAVHSAGDYNAWKDAIRKVRAEKTAARYYLAASFASVILKPCGLLPFLVHMWGASEGGKTVSLMIAASVWANPELGEYVTTYNGTRYAQETTAAFLNNLPLCLDELQIQASQGQKDFDAIIYQLCEGVSKGQGAASGGLRKQSRWRNVILSNGEHSILKPLSGGGARNRVIEVEAPGKIYSDLVGLCEVIKRNYGYAGREFVEWLSDDENMDKMREIQTNYYHQLQEIGATDKQIASASAMLTADALVTELIFKDQNGLTVEDMIPVLLTRDDIDANAKTYDWLLEHVAANSIHFDGENCKGEIWGQIDQVEEGGPGTIYFIRSIFDREIRAKGLDSKSFLSWAERTGKLEHQPGRFDTQKRIVGTKGHPRCVAIKFKEQTETEVKPEEMTPEKLPF